MSRVENPHRTAMDLAENAFVAGLHGDKEQALELTRQAFRYESEAERLVAAGLAGSPPPEIARELRALLEEIHSITNAGQTQPRRV